MIGVLVAQEEVVTLHRSALGVDLGDVPSQGNAWGPQHPLHSQLRLLGRKSVLDFVCHLREWW